MRKSPDTIGKSLTRALLNAFCFTCFVGAGFLFATMSTQEVVQAEAIEKPTAPGSPAWMLHRHDCWTGHPPADMVGVVPGHVVYTEAGVTRYGGPEKVDTALRMLFEGEPTEIETVHGFCR